MSSGSGFGSGSDSLALSLSPAVCPSVNLYNMFYIENMVKRTNKSRDWSVFIAKISFMMQRILYEPKLMNTNSATYSIQPPIFHHIYFNIQLPFFYVHLSLSLYISFHCEWFSVCYICTCAWNSIEFDESLFLRSLTPIFGQIAHIRWMAICFEIYQ